MKKIIYSIIMLFVAAPLFAQTPIYLDRAKPMEERVEDALSRMTTEEKIAVIHAQSKFSSPGVPRLGIPENWMTDGPHGIRNEVLWDEWNGANWTNDSCIAYPALTALAATWSTQMSALYGKSIGEDARYRNKNVLLGPGVNIYRTPLNGRNFEYMGEDPYLASVMVVPYIQEVQKNGVAACVKHYALNNQEKFRHEANIVLSERALREIYLPAFKASVHEGGAWAMMGAYNRFEGEYCCHNNRLLNKILKDEWGFDGVVVSDWGGTHDTKQAIHNGLDMEFGTWTDGLTVGLSNAYDKYYMAQPYLQMIESGEVGTDELNDKVRRVLRLAFRTTMDPDRPYGSFATEEHAMAGRQIAEQGVVLLKNKNNILPVDISKSKKILVVGENATKMMTVGGGSSSLKVTYEVSPLDGIKGRVGEGAEITYVKGYESPAVKEQDVKGAKAPEKKSIDLRALRAEAVAAAKGVDVVLFFGGLNKHPNQDSESDDRLSYGLPYEQDILIEELVAANPNVVVLLVSGNAVEMPWVDRVSSIAQVWYSGTEAGNAIAAVVFGDVNPSGKLPFTFPVKLEDNGAHAMGDYPGDGGDVEYKEDIFVGYRWHDTKKIKPLFAFGHGLSYTTFQYGKATADKKSMTQSDKITVTIAVTNSGSRSGYEVVQLYVSDKKSSLPRPEKELKGFDKVWLEAGETKNVSFTIDKQALSFYDDRSSEWVAEAGRFELLIGSSSADIRSKVAFDLK